VAAVAGAAARRGLSGAPETGFFNFVTGLRSPLRQEQIFPGHLDAAAEARAAERLEAAGPRFFLLVNQPAPAFESAAFGRDYATRFWGAVERRYRLVASFGKPRPTLRSGGRVSSSACTSAGPAPGPLLCNSAERRSWNCAEEVVRAPTGSERFVNRAD